MKQLTWHFPSRLSRVLLGPVAFLGLLSTTSAQTETVDPLLPVHGVVFRSGGLMSDRTLLVYDLRGGTLRSEVTKAGASVKADNILSSPIILTSQQQEKVAQLLTSIANTQDKRVFGNSTVTADYIVWMQMRLSKTVISINPYGPPQSTLKELNTYLWDIVSEAGK
ncbi:hypothetical protein EHF33_16285 (plasmid) [Deinococcus psychrotolerans]|uniref:Uncharacterized protein n=2 Tax=Deinococcus psychrotolerans TaxID=2489213 RepID=A0A3G8YHK0_9DEIO|nr:hypothetical protein EHF33_16285 [Deinococcus psychrotolerans]